MRLPSDVLVRVLGGGVSVSPTTACLLPPWTLCSGAPTSPATDAVLTSVPPLDLPADALAGTAHSLHEQRLTQRDATGECGEVFMA